MSLEVALEIHSIQGMNCYQIMKKIHCLCSFDTAGEKLSECENCFWGEI